MWSVLVRLGLRFGEASMYFGCVHVCYILTNLKFKLKHAAMT